jgi:hypothetical protein
VRKSKNHTALRLQDMQQARNFKLLALRLNQAISGPGKQSEVERRAVQTLNLNKST